MNKEKCTVCNSTNTRPDYDSPDTMTNCDNCGSEWTIDGVLTFDARDLLKEEGEEYYNNFIKNRNWNFKPF